MRKTKASRNSLAQISNSDIDGIAASIEVRRHPAARRLTLRVSRTRRAVIVTLPVQCGLDEAGNFLNRNIEWVRERLDTIPEPVPFHNGTRIPIRGKIHRILMPGYPTRQRAVRVQGSDPLPELFVPGSLNEAQARLRSYLGREARRDLHTSVARHADRLGVVARGIAIRDQSSRWGSCSTTGMLSFSWRLILAPSFVLDYVAAHEVAHLREMNHGPQFWSLVRQTCPQMDEAKFWLRRCGMDLHRYGIDGAG